VIPDEGAEIDSGEVAMSVLARPLSSVWHLHVPCSARVVTESSQAQYAAER
jgi:hypothetical protein